MLKNVRMFFYQVCQAEKQTLKMEILVLGQALRDAQNRLQKTLQVGNPGSRSGS